MSWRAPLDSLPEGAVAASGFSCRCQTHRLTGRHPPHPAEILLQALEGEHAGHQASAAIGADLAGLSARPPA